MKAYSSSCSQIALVYLQPLRRNSLLKSLAQPKNAKENNKTCYLGSSGSFKVIDFDTTEKLVTSACCNRQHAHAYQQPFSRRTVANNGKITTFTGVPLFDALMRRFP